MKKKSSGRCGEDEIFYILKLVRKTPGDIGVEVFTGKYCLLENKRCQSSL